MTRADAIALAARQRAELAKVLSQCGYMAGGHDERRRKRDEANAAAVNALTEAGAVIRDDWRGTVLKFDGIRCTCTGGIAGALSNWLARAAKEQAR